jgi:arsenite methyltransferase
VDWVISNCVINLSPEKHRVFSEIARVLKSGGTMMVSDIVAEKLPPEVLESPILYSSCVAGAISEKDYIAGLEAAGLVDVEVLNRLVYDNSQLESLIASELAELKESFSCCDGSKKGGGWAERLASAVSGKIWSVKVRARKP